MSKSDITHYIDIAFAVGGYIFTRSIAKFAAIKKQWDKLEESIVLMENSIKKAHARIDELTKHRLNENGDN